MNVKNIFFIFIMMISISLSYSSSFDVCGITIDEPWVEFQNSDGESVLIIDNDGDIYTLGQDHTEDNTGSYESIVIGNTHFNEITSKYSSLLTGQTNIPALDGFLVKDSIGNNLTLITNSGAISTKGNSIVEGSNGACSADGNYCSGDYIQTRDYYCDVTGNRAGACAYSVSSSVNCNNNNVWVCTSSNVRAIADYTCGSGPSCTVGSYTNQYNCNNDNYYYCSGGNLYRYDYDCVIVSGSASCGGGSGSLYDNCGYTCSGNTCYDTWLSYNGGNSWTGSIGSGGGYVTITLNTNGVASAYGCDGSGACGSGSGTVNSNGGFYIPAEITSGCYVDFSGLPNGNNLDSSYFTCGGGPYYMTMYRD